MLGACAEKVEEVAVATGEPQEDFKTEESDLSLEDLIAKHTEARGGAEALANLQNVQLEGTFWSEQEGTFMVENAPVVVTLAPDHFHRAIEGGIQVDVVNGESGWRMTPELPEPTPLADADAARYRRQGDVAGALVDAASKGHTLELQDKIEDEGKVYYRVQVSFANGGSALYFVDGETFLVQRIREGRKIEGYDITQVTSFDDYKAVEGVVLPHVERVELLEADFRQESTWQTVTVNPELPAEFFGKPASS